MAFARWDPIRDLLAIQQRLDRFTPNPAGWRPAVDLHETPTDYVLTAEVPGVAREDIHIHFHDSRLTISGQRAGGAGSSQRPCEQFHRVERGHGNFSRTFQLPIPVDGNGITADLRDGILTVVCPKSAEAAARRIEIT